FWSTANSKTINSVKQIHAIVDGKAVVISKSSVRSDILFDDEDGNGYRSQSHAPRNHGRVTTLENDLSSTKAVYHKAFVTLTKRVKKLFTKLKQKRSRAVIHSSNEEEPSVDIKDSPKQWRMIEKLDKDKNVNLVNEQGEVHETDDPSKDDDDATLAETLLNIKRSTTKDKGKESSKKQKLDEQKEEEVEAQVDSDQEVEEMNLYMRIVLDEDIVIDAIPLATKPSVIVEYKIVKEGKI
nr:hypothetical protein [Tanacetum cinerariifolium]